MASFQPMLSGVWQVAGKMKRHLICFYTAIFLVPCGNMLGLGSVFQELTLIVFVITFFQFIHYIGDSKIRWSFLQLLWLMCVWLIWNERNNRIFNNVETPIKEIMGKVKYNSYCWLKANKANFVYGSQRL